MIVLLTFFFKNVWVFNKVHIYIMLLERCRCQWEHTRCFEHSRLLNLLKSTRCTMYNHPLQLGFVIFKWQRSYNESAGMKHKETSTIDYLGHFQTIRRSALGTDNIHKLDTRATDQTLVQHATPCRSHCGRRAASSRTGNSLRGFEPRMQTRIGRF